ncbi:calcium-activated chloride channel regulator 1-like [Megalobrama amblycephala]|uniref:calcium-activated chloride channel regulator 1-like n=1 Tax=Megalobrama amblycephala TaxID=75352 RepID=UPI00201411B6|nr:calcium-activated chloride channel regulator 1-like [Megalobrama amblycephala]
MDSRTVFVLLWMLLSSSTGIKLDGNGYVDVTIAISSRVQQDNTLIDKIKDMVTKGSIHLHQALDKKVYFKEATILVPPDWNSTEYTKARTESYEKANVRIDNANPAYGDEPYTLQYGECGDEGQFIHFTPNFLRDDKLIKTYGSRGKVLVHEWAHLRWGVYDEYSETNPFYYSNGRIEATRCSKNTEGQFYDESLRPCQTDPQTLLPTKGCKFFPNKYQNTDSSIMFLPSLDSVSTFCRENEHNYKAPNLQNKKCGKATRTVIFEDSVDKDALRSLKPLLSSPPAPTFKVVQRKHRVVCLVLDVSGSMDGSRILRQQQAATYFLQHIIEDQASVGIVTFSTNATTLSPLTTIDNNSTRDKLIELLPKVAKGWTYICKGLNLGLQVLKNDNGDVNGDEIIFLTDGEATDDINTCVPAAIENGTIINTLALGDKADKALREMAEKTGGNFFTASDDILSNQLLNGFFSLKLPTGDQTKDPVQIDSAGKKTSDWFNGTILVDQTIGNKTSFTITYEKSLPDISIQSPSGSTYKQVQMRHYESAKTVTLKVPGTAQPGDWKYSMQTTISQSLTVTAMSQAARADVPPIVVKARMNQQFSDGTKPLIVFAEVSQNYMSVIKTEVWATLESESGSAEELQLLDNGAGADAFRDDGIYSRYFTQMKKGRSSLKIRVKNLDGQARFTIQKRGGAPYVPGYVVNGVVELNPPKPPVSEEPLEVGRFTRTATGESFEVAFTGTTPPNFPPNRITDLSAEIQEDSVLLSWTAPGEDLDQGTAKSYEIRWSYDLQILRENFSNAHVVNTAAISPLEAGSAEQHSFNLSFTIQNGTTLFFAVQSEDEQNAKSETSNIAQASKMLPDSLSSGQPLQSTATRECFEVVFTGTTPPNFPPNKITDLSADIQEDSVLLSWTAPGEDLNQGTAKSYEIRWSYDLQMLRESFNNGHVVNTSAVSPLEAGSVEQHSFNLSFTIQYGTTLFFAVQSEDKQNAKSETSNIAQASKILPDSLSSGQPLQSTATGESFEVAFTGTTPPNFPPNKITDLSAEVREDSVFLSWTAPGEDLDQGTAKSYEIRWSYDLQILRESFSNGHVVNTAAVSPLEAGSAEQHSFNLSFTIQYGTTLFFAVQSEDKQNAKSETSNIAQASKILPDPTPSTISNPGLNLTVLVISLCVIMVICFVVAVITWSVRRRKSFDISNNWELTIWNPTTLEHYLK